MRSFQLGVNPDSLEVGWSGTAWIGLSPSGENFQALGFASNGQVFETLKTPKNGRFLNQTMGTETNGSYWIRTQMEEFLSDTEIGSSSVSVGSTRSQDGRWLECFLPRTRLITRADSNYSGGHEKR